MRIPALMILLSLSSQSVSAESLFEKIGEGAGKAASAVGKGMEAAGGAIEKGADAVERTVDSTQELFREEDSPEKTRAKLDVMESNLLTRLITENQLARDTFDVSAGYAVFDMRRVTVFPLTGGLGRGVAVSRDGSNRTYMMMGTGGVGAAFGIGGFESQFVILFETQSDYDRFVEYGYEAEADAGVASGEDRTTQTVKFTQGRSFFVLDKKSWRVNANASGTRYWPDENLN